jgi:hypothetical protein
MQKSVASTLLVNASNNEKQKTNQRHVFFALLKPSLFKPMYRKAQLLITDKYPQDRGLGCHRVAMIIGATVNVQDERTAILAFLVAKNNKAKNMKLEINALNNRIDRTL